MNDRDRVQKARVTGFYGLIATTYDRIGPRVASSEGRRLVELAQLPAGARVLDVAAGRGAVLFPASERVGPEGQAIGIDITPEMVWETSAELEQLGLSNAEMHRMDAEELDFPDASFDWVLCGFGLFFLPNLDRALSEFYRVLKPGGGFGASTDGEPDERWLWWSELLSAYDAETNPVVRDFADPEELPAALREAGFVDVRVIEEEYDVLYASEEEWWAGRLPWLRPALGPEALERLKAEALANIESHGLKLPGGVHRLSRVRYNFAGKPGG